VVGDAAAAGAKISVRATRFAGETIGNSVGAARKNPCNCFVAGTLVLAGGRLVPIEEVEPGDLVQARDDGTGVTSLKPVLQLIGNPAKHVIALTFVDTLGVEERLEVTEDHPFMTLTGWQLAAEMPLGTALKTYDGRALSLQSRVDEGKQARTYNFEVAESHTYFVGRSGAWVHNSGPCKVGGAAPTGVIRSSETIGQPVEAVIGGRKRLLRVDIEPNGKLQIQSGRGKESIVDFRPDLSQPLAPQIDSAFRRLPQSVRDQLTKNAEKGVARLKETGNL
jgi:hypothetical protein